MAFDIDFLCPIFETQCLQHKCPAFIQRTQQYFYDVVNGRHIPYAQLYKFRMMDDEEREASLRRDTTTYLECKKLSKTLAIINDSDNELPNEII